MSGANISVVVVGVFLFMFGILSPLIASDADIVWEGGDVLFSVDDFVPGDTLSKNIQIENYRDESLKVYFEVEKGSVFDEDFSEKLFLSLGEKSGKTFLVGGSESPKSLYEIIQSGEMCVDTLEKATEIGDKKEYIITILFDENASSEYQEKSLTFAVTFRLEGSSIQEKVDEEEDQEQTEEEKNLPEEEGSQEKEDVLNTTVSASQENNFSDDNDDEDDNDDNKDKKQSTKKKTLKKNQIFQSTSSIRPYFSIAPIIKEEEKVLGSISMEAQELITESLESKNEDSKQRVNEERNDHGEQKKLSWGKLSILLGLLGGGFFLFFFFLKRIRRKKKETSSEENKVN